MPEPSLHPTSCALCGPGAQSRQLYPAQLNEAAFSGATFSARRLPDKLHYRIVRCVKCGLVRSDPVADSELLGQLYAESAFTYRDELVALRRTYGRYLRMLEQYGVRKQDLLEIGCGNGFFLEEALDQGYASVRGVEPSRMAIEQASARVRPFLVCDVLRPGLLEDSSFDVVCLFQVLDHVPDPRAFLDECHRLLRPGGLLLAVNHNVGSFSARLLGERSPIFDIEHTFLYAPSTMRAIAHLTGFPPQFVSFAVNTCTVRHLIWLLPLPATLKRVMRAAADWLGLGGLHVSLPLGNLAFIGRKSDRRTGPRSEQSAPAGTRSAR